MLKADIMVLHCKLPQSEVTQTWSACYCRKRRTWNILLISGPHEQG
jgi:hypothetical protein